ncbi:MAG: hypothetical protein ABFD89_26180 [Bryobacteraceae bacterium]
MSCPECLSHDVEIREYDFGICQQTGYRDAGERFRCRQCRADGDATDLVPCNSISVGSSEPPLGGGWPDCTLRLAIGAKKRLTEVDTVDTHLGAAD